MKIYQPWSTVSVGLALLIVIAGVSFAKSPPPDFDHAFSRLESLVGTWDVEGSDRVVVYSLTGRDKTVVENFTGERSMATFYHRDGDDLRLTHYCNAGNQPRMKAVAYDAKKGRLRFEFVDVTNLSAPDAYHTRDLEIHFRDDDHIELAFTGKRAGETFPSVLSLTRRTATSETP